MIQSIILICVWATQFLRAKHFLSYQDKKNQRAHTFPCLVWEVWNRITKHVTIQKWKTNPLSRWWYPHVLNNVSLYHFRTYPTFTSNSVNMLFRNTRKTSEIYDYDQYYVQGIVTSSIAVQMWRARGSLFVDVNVSLQNTRLRRPQRVGHHTR